MLIQRAFKPLIMRSSSVKATATGNAFLTLTHITNEEHESEVRVVIQEGGGLSLFVMHRILVWNV